MHDYIRFGSIVKVLKSFNDQVLGNILLKKLENRWKQWEQPLLLLAFLLHPLYRNSKFNSNASNLSFFI